MSEDAKPTPIMSPSVWFEDFQAGQVYGSLRRTVTESEIIDFATRYDPQPFHTSVPDAEESMFGGLIASGFMTMALTFRLIWQSNGFQTTGAGSNGIDKLRWLKPVRPGDTLRAEMAVLSTRESKSRPEIGIVLLQYSAINQDEEVVLTMECPQFVKRRT
jgi:acyl dehydratase